MQAQNDITPWNSMFFSFIAFDFPEIFLPSQMVALFALGKPSLSKGIDIQAL
ncbi:hypothetical protein J4727_19435 [Providencia rettgeri]|uniref:Uncharacterized protein n=1 Tax=Providencia rettgeri TaxID=587 RepID=A0A939NGD3_PRORE|nr:hypothetical protein [Providencia rettgeri]